MKLGTSVTGTFTAGSLPQGCGGSRRGHGHTHAMSRLVIRNGDPQLVTAFDPCVPDTVTLLLRQSWNRASFLETF